VGGFSSSFSNPALPILPLLPVLPVVGQASACPRHRGRADARSARPDARYCCETVYLATPRGALRAQAVLSARTRTRFLPRNPARADEETANAPGMPRGSILTAKNAKTAKRRYTNATAWYKGEAVPATRRSDGAWQCGAGIPACHRRRAQTGMSAPHWGLLAPIVPVDTCRHLSIPVGSYRSSSSAGSAGGLDDEEAPRSPPGRVVPLS
jgi:hypothetical protein